MRLRWTASAETLTQVSTASCPWYAVGASLLLNLEQHLHLASTHTGIPRLPEFLTLGAMYRVPGVFEMYFWLVEVAGHSSFPLESWHRLQETSNDAPGPFPQPDVAAGSPYTDQQQIVQDTSDTPFSAVGQLLIYGPLGSGICTGSYIAPGVVLTAGETSSEAEGCCCMHDICWHS